MRRLLAAILLLLVLTLDGRAGLLDGFEWFETAVLDRFNFMPEFHLSADAKAFLNHKNDAYRKRYFIEWNNDLELALFDYRELIYSVWYLQVRTGLGRQDQMVIFDPRDSRYGLTPAWELRLKSFNLQTGLAHFCFHDIDRDDGMTEYWNMPYINVSSKNYRPGEYRRGLVTEGKWDTKSRLAWLVQGSHYAHTVFDMFPSEIISGGHDYDWEATVDVRYAFYRRLSWIASGHLWANVDITRGGDVLQSYMVGIEGDFRRGKNGFQVYTNYYLLDQLRVRPKDRLVEIGFRFYL